ncbi:MAG: tetratricopeptide repeat protein [Chloroflexota bacterium]|nr:tetratricopeptide repeat protein [Chloroflexota bacterium]
MQCPACGFENPDGFAFCGQCGNKLVTTCPNCGAESPPGFAFCGQCGTRLASPLPPEGGVEGDTPSTLITEADLSRLKPYLPSHQFDDLPLASLWKQEDLARVHDQLSNLLDVVITYLPRHLVQTELAPGKVPPVGGAFLDGALLFADISGFTAMSERLSTLGRVGAEEITYLVNRYFSAMLEVLFAHGGDLFKFGGDALLAFFPDQPDSTSPLEGGPRGVTNGLRAAWAMQEAMTAFHRVETSLGTFPLQMKIGMHAGPVFTVRVGTSEGREFMVTGPTVNATAKAEGLASAGQILISPTIYQQAQDEGCDWLTAVEGPVGHYLVEHVRPCPLTPSYSPTPTPPSSLEPGDALHWTLDALDRLTPYLPSGLLPRLVPDPSHHETGGEHRLVVVLFANFLGASELITHLGPGHEDEIAQALNGYFVAMHQAVSRYGGVVNKTDLYDHGDKLMALFGAPVAHENDAERAVRAALEMQTSIASLPPVVGGEGEIPWFLGQCIGINTGLVFAGHVGAVTRREYTVMGDEVNLAARLMSAAAGGEVLLSSDVQRKVSPFFELADRGEVRLKGKSKPVPTYTIVGHRAQPEPVRGIRGLRSPLVGRADEEATMQRSVADLRTGQGSILSLVGEAGLGKSRLVAELRAQAVVAGDLTWLEGRCLSYTQQVSYSAFTDVLHPALGVVETDNERDTWAKLRRRVDELLPGEEGEDILPYLAHFLNLPLSGPEAERVAYLEGEALQRQVLRAVAVFLEHLAHDHPLVLAFDDLHWADSASLALLERCLTLTDRAPVLIFLLYRPERTHGCWSLGQTGARNYPHRYTEINLAPLDSDAGQDEQLVRNLLSLEQLPPTLRQLINRAEGNPFYVEETIRTLIDQGTIVRDDSHWRLTQEIDLETIPDTLQGLIMARLDRLVEEARRTLQLASVVGRIFRHHVLARLTSVAAGARLVGTALVAQLDASLASLQRTELVRERSRLPEPEYGFKQAMIRDVAYESLLVRDRRVYHGLLGDQMESLYPGPRREEVYELLAHHYRHSDDQEKALVYLIKAGDKARAAYANPEAISLYRQAESLAEQLERPDDRAATAEGLGDVLFHIGEYDEALACYERALDIRSEATQRADLHRRIGMVHEKRGEYERALSACAQGIELLSPDGEKTVEMARLLIARCRAYWQQGQFDVALTDGQQSLLVLEGTNHYREIAQTHNELGNAYVRYSQPDQAIVHLERGLGILERIGDEHEAARVYGNLAFIYSQTDLARSAAYLGRVLETMQRLGNVWGESQTYQNLGAVHYLQGDYVQAIQYYKHSLKMKERLGDNLGIADCYINLGEAYRAQGDPTQAVVHLEKGLSIAQEIGASQAETECHRQLAECYLEIKDLDRAMTACREALAHARKIGDRKEEGIIYRVLGNVYLQGKDLVSALTHLEQSVAILRELNQEFDLGTALYDYAQVLIQSGKAAPARERLTEALVLFERLQLPQEQARVQAALDQLA